MPDAPDVKAFAATPTAWSEWVPVPKEKSIIIALPQWRSLIKKFAADLTLRAARTPIHVMPRR